MALLRRPSGRWRCRRMRPSRDSTRAPSLRSAAPCRRFPFVLGESSCRSLEGSSPVAALPREPSSVPALPQLLARWRRGSDPFSDSTFSWCSRLRKLLTSPSDARGRSAAPPGAPPPLSLASSVRPSRSRSRRRPRPLGGLGRRRSVDLLERLATGDEALELVAAVTARSSPDSSRSAELAQQVARALDELLLAFDRGEDLRVALSQRGVGLRELVDRGARPIPGRPRIGGALRRDASRSCGALRSDPRTPPSRVPSGSSA